MVTRTLTRFVCVLGAAGDPAGRAGRKRHARRPQTVSKSSTRICTTIRSPTRSIRSTQVLEIFRRNGVTGILATSRPNKGTHQLMDAKAPGLWVVPFIRPYRMRADIQTWFNDPAIFDLVKAEYERGYYRGVGEFHIYGKSAADRMGEEDRRFRGRAESLSARALRRGGAAASCSRTIRKRRSSGRIPAFRRRRRASQELFATYPDLWGELSYRSGITDRDGKLTADWRELFARHSERFLIGSDTWINERWFSYDAIMKGYRAWLAQLPREQAERIANGNAKRLFGGRPMN